MRKVIITEGPVVNKTENVDTGMNDANVQDTKSNMGAKKVNRVNTGKSDSANATTQIVGNVKLSKLSILLVALLDQLMDLAVQYVPQLASWIESLIQ